MLTSNDGQTYSDWMDYYAQQRSALNLDPAEGTSNVTYGIQHGDTGHVTPLGSDIKQPLQIQKNMLEYLNLPTRIHGKTGSENIDYNHHVPLLASSKMDGSGIYVDSRLEGQLSKEEEGLLQDHEGIEHHVMNKLTGNGVPGPWAYDIAHPIATAAETEISKSIWGEEGHEKYKDRMRQFAELTKQDSDRSVASDAHTTFHGLDRAELGTAEGAKYAGLMDWLFGGDTAQAKGHPAQYPMAMPTSSEAQEARKGESSYGSPTAAFEEGERGRFIKPGIIEPIFNEGVEKGFKPNAFDVLKKTPTININPEFKEKVADIYTKARLVANRSPLTALGFDPRHASIEANKNLVGTVGLFDKLPDQAWVTLSNEDVLAHELTHRGINELKKAGRLTPEETKWLEANNNWHDERMVRYLMDRYAHQESSVDPNPEASEANLKEARSVFEDNPKNMHMLQEIESKAQDLYHEKYGQMHHAEADKPFKVAEDTGTHAPITKSDIHDPFATPPPASEHKPLQVDPMASGGPSGAYAPMLKLPSGKEISLARSLKEVSPERREEVLNRIFQRQFPGTKSIGYQKKEFEESKKKLGVQ